MPGPPPPGWYLDPADVRWLRWWDGSTWTASVAPRPAPGPPMRSRRWAAVVAVTVGAVAAWLLGSLILLGVVSAAPTTPASELVAIEVGAAVLALATGLAAGWGCFRWLTTARR